MTTFGTQEPSFQKGTQVEESLGTGWSFFSWGKGSPGVSSDGAARKFRLLPSSSLLGDEDGRDEDLACLSLRLEGKVDMPDARTLQEAKWSG